MDSRLKKCLTRQFSILLVVLVLLCATAPGVLAQPTQLCDLRIEYLRDGMPLDNVQFRLYRIANLDDNLHMVFTGIFSGLKLDAQGIEHSVTDLRDMVLAKNAEPELVLTTDKNGCAVAEDIPRGVFLVAGDAKTVGSMTFHVDWQILSLPTLDQDTGKLHYDVTRYPKFTQLPAGVQLIGIKTQKRWEDSGFENDRPNAISVSLLRDGKVVSTVTLSEANGWAYTWKDLLPNVRWTVQEHVPEGYIMNVEKVDNEFVITNKHINIDQTGQVWWPIVVVLTLGFLMVVAGVSLRRSGRHEA